MITFGLLFVIVGLPAIAFVASKLPAKAPVDTSNM